MLTQSAPFLYCKECGIQKVAEITPPLSPNDGFAARGSTSWSESCLFALVDKLIRRKISWLDFAPEAASEGDCATASRGLLKSGTKYEETALLGSDAYSP